MRSFWSLTASASTSRPASVRAALPRAAKWTVLLASYRTEYPELANEIDQMQRRDLPAGWDRNLPVFAADAKGIAGRDASGKVLNMLAQNIPWFLGGSADLEPSNTTTLTYEGAGSFQAGNRGGKNLRFGIREHAMAAIVIWAVALEAAGVRRDVLRLQ
jgi:transketolase